MYRGGAVNCVNFDSAAFDARSMKYFIFIEGRWNANTQNREEKEKKKTKSKFIEIDTVI